VPSFSDLLESARLSKCNAVSYRRSRSGLVKRAIFGANLERLYGHVRHAEQATEDGYTAIKRR
jgi:hypothetical protein